MIQDVSPGLQRELLDDFFTECDEHLTHIRQALVLLEPSIGKAQADSTLVEDLFRNFHSFKGISAIVGLRAAEELAHATEDYLRELTRGKISLSHEGLELLMTAAQRLEQMVVAFRGQQPIAANPSLLNALGNISGNTSRFERPAREQPGAQNLDDGSVSSSEEGLARGLVLWKCTFVPSRELDARGININTVRSRLSQAGEILKATPQVRGQGRVAFEFLVGMKETPADITNWEADGLVTQLVEQNPSVPAEPGKLAAESLALDPNHNPFISPSHVVRVDLQRLDELMRLVGQMVIQRSRFEAEIGHSSKQGKQLDRQILQEVNGGLGRSLRELREAIMRVRLVSVAEIFARMPFVVRDLARDSQKKVRLHLQGQQTEIDKYLIEQLKDPLLHLVRNSFSHGVETAAERRSSGKSEEASIFLQASTSGDSVIITVGDDGRGIDRKAVFKRAAKMGMEVPETQDNAALLKILCASGFSTRDDVDRASGRGVGMAVVCNTVRELGGTLALESEEKRGTKFTIRLPLTLSIAETFIVSASDQTCAVPQSFVTEIIQVTEDQVTRLNGLEVIPYRLGVLPIVRLASIFNLPRQPLTRFSVLVLNSDRGSSGLLVDRVHGQKEVVVRSISDPLIQVAGISGATELGDGRPVLILDAAALTSGAVRPKEIISPQNN